GIRDFHVTGVQTCALPICDQTALVQAFALSALMLISGIILSVIVVFRAADRIARARETGAFDLLAVTPGGSFGASWAIFTASLRSEERRVGKEWESRRAPG